MTTSFKLRKQFHIGTIPRIAAKPLQLNELGPKAGAGIYPFRIHSLIKANTDPGERTNK